MQGRPGLASSDITIHARSRSRHISAEHRSAMWLSALALVGLASQALCLDDININIRHSLPHPRVPCHDAWGFRKVADGTVPRPPWEPARARVLS